MRSYYLVGAAPLGGQRLVLTANARDPVEQVIAQKNAFFDLGIVPSNADAFNLTTYWAGLGFTAGLGRSNDKQAAEDFFAMREASIEAAAADPNGPVPNPDVFWDVLKDFAIEVSSLSVVPTRWELIKESVSEAVVEAPGVIKDKVLDTAEALGQAAGSVGKGLLGPWGLAFLGLGVLGIGYLAMKKK